MAKKEFKKGEFGNELLKMQTGIVKHFSSKKKDERTEKKEKAQKKLYKMGVEKVGPEKTAKAMKMAFNKRGTSTGYMVGGKKPSSGSPTIDDENIA